MASPRIPVIRDSNGVAHHVVDQEVTLLHADCGRSFNRSRGADYRSIDRIKRKCTDCRWPPEDADRWHPLANLEADI